eukprot:13167246-Alexandrium_andersonii.AAC.1
MFLGSADIEDCFYDVLTDPRTALPAQALHEPWREREGSSGGGLGGAPSVAVRVARCALPLARAHH